MFFRASTTLAMIFFIVAVMSKGISISTQSHTHIIGEKTLAIFTDITRHQNKDQNEQAEDMDTSPSYGHYSYYHSGHSGYGHGYGGHHYGYHDHGYGHEYGHGHHGYGGYHHYGHGYDHGYGYYG